MCALLCAGAASADPIDGVELSLGATNVNAALGDGHLSVGVAQTGEVTVLRWPGPGSPDHIRYQTRPVDDAGMTARNLPYFGAQPDMGFFVGISTGGSTSWLRDSPWSVSQAWASVDSPVLVTTYQRPDGVRAVQEDFVAWQQDVLVRRIHFSGLPSPTSAVVYGAMAPCSARSTGVPIDDWAYDRPALGQPVDFALFYSPADDALVQFRPQEQAVAGLQAQAAQSVASARGGADAGAVEVAALDAHFGPGFFIAWGGLAGSAAHAAEVMDYPGRDGGPSPAFQQASQATLANTLAALAPASGALSFGLAPVNGEADFTVFITAGGSAAAAFSALASARSSGPDSLESATVQAWSQLTGGLTLPNTPDPTVRAVALRALMNIVTATDAATGAVVASITTQPPYAEDWARDSAFIDYALERAGLGARAEANALFLASVQRTIDQPGMPAGSFAANYYPDGRSGLLFPFEIDETGLALWSFCEHAQWLTESGADAGGFVAQIYPAVKRAADLLVTCKDASGLQCAANEDDQPALTQTLDGAAAVYAGLAAAADLAHNAGQSSDEVAWRARAAELRGAIFSRFLDASGHLVGERGARAWAIWPAGLVSDSQSRTDAEADVLLDDLQGVLGGGGPGSTYDGKLTSAVAIALPADNGRRARLQPLLKTLLTRVPTGTQSYGEVYVTLPGQDGVVYQDRVAIPHVWEGTLSYISAMEFYAHPLPAGCGCASPDGAGLPWVAAALALCLRRLRRRER